MISDASPKPSDALALLAWLDGDLLVNRFARELAEQASPLQKLSRAEREKRVTALESELLSLRYAEEQLVCLALANAEDVTRDASAPPECVLGVKVATAVGKRTATAA